MNSPTFRRNETLNADKSALLKGLSESRDEIERLRRLQPEAQIAALRAENTTLKGQIEALKLRITSPGWIPITKPPTEADGVNVPWGDVAEVLWLHMGDKIRSDAWNYPYDATHWYHMPTPPKTDTEKDLVECDCDCASKCPQGKTGMAPKCKIWKAKA